MVNNIKKTLIKTSETLEVIENIKVLIHRLNNILTLNESCINRLNNSSLMTLNKRWITMKDVINATGRDRIYSEIVLYKKTKDIIKNTFGEKYNDIFKQFSDADHYFKTMFDSLDGSDSYSEKNKNMTLANGDKLVEYLKDIIKKLEEIKIELQK